MGDRKGRPYELAPQKGGGGWGQTASEARRLAALGACAAEAARSAVLRRMVLGRWGLGPDGERSEAFGGARSLRRRSGL